ncbi:MAG: methyltransferase domain-containing protein [Cytophagales bacterium]|nr:MAG: methyltransferase domain-containing protein [Cytophagales bacterium]
MTHCSLCYQEAELVYESLIGYQEGSTYNIHYCSHCDASYASPLQIDDNLYNVIYSKAEQLPGYSRYHRFAEDVLKVRNPFLFLAETEDTYWAIYDYLKNQSTDTDAKILEVGCGLGYLTYALVKEGFNAEGVDISHKAVDEAIKRYGAYYSQADIYQLAQNPLKQYDIIILTEVIEHVPDPVGFINSLTKLLLPKGRILVTTPNKHSVVSHEKYWDTELPPVHLWWLSEKSFVCISDKLSLNVRFADFTKYQVKIKQERVYGDPWRKQTLSSEGDILFEVPHNGLRYVIRRNLIDYGLLSQWQDLKSKFQKSQYRENLSVSDRLCAILSKKDE